MINLINLGLLDLDIYLLIFTIFYTLFDFYYLTYLIQENIIQENMLKNYLYLNKLIL